MLRPNNNLHRCIYVKRKTSNVSNTYSPLFRSLALHKKKRNENWIKINKDFCLHATFSTNYLNIMRYQL